ncbi:MAG: IreB family regulatory phosphoprotein [Clostridia bacterium]|nr:IreB family regulatory phosphoprotein [Clostridia bacterium]
MDNIKKGDTQKIELNFPVDKDMMAKVKYVFDALNKKGYDGANQIIGYLVTDDPTYITTFDNARNVMREVDRYDLLFEMFDAYMKLNGD